VGEDKTRVYLERSKSSRISLFLDRDGSLSPYDPFFEIIPHVVGRLKSLSVWGKPKHLRDITAQLFHPTPVLEELLIYGDRAYPPHHNHTLTSALFNGNLSSLRELSLESVRTNLPWRNMVNLTSFTLARTLPSDLSAKHLLDFFEGAPCLRNIGLHLTVRTCGTRNGRLVSLECLEWMYINGGGPISHLLNHLLIPVGAELTTRIESPTFAIEDYLPRSLDNLRNFPNFTAVKLYSGGSNPRMRFTGPNGQVTMIPRTSRVDGTRLVLESLAQLDTSKTEQLEISCGDPPSSGPPYRALLPMKALRTLTLSQCIRPHPFIGALHPDAISSEPLVCPKLEELTLVLHNDGEIFDIKRVIGMAAARASKGAKLKSVRIFGQDEFGWADVLELEKHVLHVECGPGVDGTGDGVGEEDQGEWGL
jgi:hypothetical protein